MKKLLLKSYVDHLVERRNGYLMLAAGSIILNIILAGVIAMTAGHELIILVPPEIERPLSVTSVRVSRDYLSDMSLFLFGLLLNLTPDNAHEQHAIFLRYVSPKIYAKLKGDLLAQEDRIGKEHMTVIFNRTGFDPDVRHLSAKISGIVEYRSGTTILATKPVSYRMTFGWHMGRFTVKSFTEENVASSAENSGRESHA